MIPKHNNRNTLQRIRDLNPLGTLKIQRYYRLGSSTAVGGEWTSVVELLGGSPLIQGDSDRAPAATSAPNGVPTATFDGTDLLRMPLDPSGTGNNGVDKVGYLFRFKPASVSGVQRLIHIDVTPNGASAPKLQLYANNATLRCECYVSGSNGRFGTTPAVLQVGVWSHIYLQYDSSRGGNANLRIYHNANSETLTFGGLGTNPALTTLSTATGHALIGAATDQDTPVQALANGSQLDSILAANDNLTDAELANLIAFEAPN